MGAVRPPGNPSSRNKLFFFFTVRPGTRGKLTLLDGWGNGNPSYIAVLLLVTSCKTRVRSRTHHEHIVQLVVVDIHIAQDNNSLLITSKTKHIPAHKLLATVVDFVHEAGLQDRWICIRLPARFCFVVESVLVLHLMGMMLGP